MNIGKVFQEERKKIKLTQTFVANEIGLSQTYLCSIETGRRIPTINVVQLLCDYYKKPLWLVLAKENTNEETIPEGKENLYRRLMKQIDELAKEIYE